MHFKESNKYLTPLQSMTWRGKPGGQPQETSDLCDCQQGFSLSEGILSHSSLQILSKSLRFRGWRLATQTFLSRGTLRALQDFSPSRRTVTNYFLGDYGPSCLEIIDKILPCSSGLIPHRSHDHWNSTRWDLAWSPRPREIDIYFVFLPFANNRTNCCHLLTKLLGDGLVAHSSLV